MRVHTIFPDEFPESWASDWGEDEYGLFMAFTYKGVRQNFRWIEQGTFLMGSPKKEYVIFSVETQHEVTLSKGFWLADTTVTQALWAVVIGENPSRFTGVSRPVENVSWNDAQSFISKMNGVKAELRLCLPTEAQWEYACRAGTSTSFHFGEQISPEIVNYNGEHFYNNEIKRDEHRGQTIDVGTLPPNDWGLYETHGNVWAWCQDKFRPYSKKPAIDPNGPSTGVDRVLRGGAWLRGADLCRSASRNAQRPNYFSSLTGFRLARQA